MQSERRAAPRVAYEGRCWLRDESSERFVFFTNVSSGGAQISTLSPLPVGHQTVMRWQSTEDPASEVVEVVAKVVWSQTDPAGRAGSMGVSFREVRTPVVLDKFMSLRVNG